MQTETKSQLIAESSKLKGWEAGMLGGQKAKKTATLRVISKC
jgi:hypothetical protein